MAPVEPAGTPAYLFPVVRLRFLHHAVLILLRRSLAAVYHFSVVLLVLASVETVSLRLASFPGLKPVAQIAPVCPLVVPVAESQNFFPGRCLPDPGSPVFVVAVLFLPVPGCDLRLCCLHQVQGLYRMPVSLPVIGRV